MQEKQQNFLFEIECTGLAWVLWLMHFLTGVLNWPCRSHLSATLVLQEPGLVLYWPNRSHVSAALALYESCETLCVVNVIFAALTLQDSCQCIGLTVFIWLLYLLCRSHVSTALTLQESCECWAGLTGTMWVLSWPCKSQVIAALALQESCECCTCPSGVLWVMHWPCRSHVNAAMALHAGVMGLLHWPRVSKTAIMRDCANFGLMNAKPEKLALILCICPNLTKCFKFYMFYVIFYAFLCLTFLIRTFWSRKRICF